jgi:hypothetical protein
MPIEAHDQRFLLATESNILSEVTSESLLHRKHCVPVNAAIWE